jgi:hypothetical protein
MNRKFNELMQPYAIHVAGMYAAIVNLSDAELAKLQVACNAATETNCWWAAHRAAQLMLPEINSEISRRRENAKKTLATTGAGAKQ